MRKIALGVLLAVFLLGSATAAAVIVTRRHAESPSSAARGRSAQAPPRVESITCRSPALGGSLPARLYLPAGYARGRGRYPVVYFLHGLPAGPQSYTQNRFVADALARAGLRAIVVAPQGARSANSDREYLDWSPTENWPRAIAHDLVSCVDRRFRTLANRDGRALVGLSAGGYGALNVGLRSLPTFGAVESWSGYFVATDPSGLHVLELPSPAALQAATVPSGATLKRALARWPALIAFYVGRADDRFADTNEAFDAQLRREGIPHLFRTYPGAHSGSLWQGQAETWVGMAIHYLARGSHG